VNPQLKLYLKQVEVVEKFNKFWFAWIEANPTANLAKETEEEEIKPDLNVLLRIACHSGLERWKIQQRRARRGFRVCNCLLKGNGVHNHGEY
jgi:hypothetical protein